jgi:SAM-dependent methyltransferase
MSPTDLTLPRRNMTESASEPWRPPSFTPAATAKDRAVAAARRFLDLQAGSIWADLAALLPRCRGVVLDVGCGAQPYRPLVSREATYMGIDDARAGEHFGYSMPDTTYFEGGRWPVGDASVDVVLSTETLEHVPDPSAFLNEAARCLRPGGQLLLTVPFAARWHYVPHDYWRYTPSGLTRLLTMAGFERIAVYARGNAVTVASYKVMALFLPLLFPRESGPVGTRLRQACGVLTLPLVVMLAAVGNLSMAASGGNDCLGYTAVAVRSGG